MVFQGFLELRAHREAKEAQSPAIATQRFFTFSDCPQATRASSEKVRKGAGWQPLGTVQRGRIVDDILLRHVISTLRLPARAWHVMVAPIGSALWPGHLPPQLRMILVPIYAAKTEDQS